MLRTGSYSRRRCIEVCSDDMVDAAWDTQFWIMTDATFAEGDK